MRDISNLERKLNYALAQEAQANELLYDAEESGQDPFSTVHIRAWRHVLQREIAATRQRLRQGFKPRQRKGGRHGTTARNP